MKMTAAKATEDREDRKQLMLHQNAEVLSSEIVFFVIVVGLHRMVLYVFCLQPKFRIASDNSAHELTFTICTFKAKVYSRVFCFMK